MDKKVTYVAIAAVLVLLVAGIAVVAMGDDEPANDPSDDMTFLIQDDEGVYFWAFGEGATIYDAFADAASDFNIPFVPSKDADGPNGISTLWNLEMKADYSKYWTQSIWDGSKWIESPKMMDNLSPEDAQHYMAVVYAPYDFDKKELVEPEDAVVWDHSNSGMTFTIKSPSSMTFQLNGEGEYAIDAMNAMADKYKLPFEASKSGTADNGIQSLFGLDMAPDIQQGLAGYSWWQQSYRNSADADWAVGQVMMDQVKVSENKEALLEFIYAPNPNSYAFLIQDDNGMNFWVNGSGATAIEAFMDACKTFEIPFVATGEPGKETGINSLWNKAMLEDYSKYWTQFIWENGKWVSSPLMMDKVTVDKCNHYMAIVYAGFTFDPKDLEKPMDAVVWDKSDDGMVFTIQSEKEGPWFKINGEGKTVYDAFVDATSTFGVEFTPSKGTDGKENGIQEMFGMEMTSTAPYSFWAQYYKNSSDTEWALGDLYMTGIAGDKYDEALIVYETMTM